MLGKDVSLAEQQLKRERKRQKRQNQTGKENSSIQYENTRHGDLEGSVIDTTKNTVDNQNQGDQSKKQYDNQPNIYKPLNKTHTESNDLIYNNL